MKYKIVCGSKRNEIYPERSTRHAAERRQNERERAGERERDRNVFKLFFFILLLCRFSFLRFFFFFVLIFIYFRFLLLYVGMWCCCSLYLYFLRAAFGYRPNAGGHCHISCSTISRACEHTRTCASVCIGSVASILRTERDGCCQISFYPFLLHFLFGCVSVSLCR